MKVVLFKQIEFVHYNINDHGNMKLEILNS